eukprot:scaffold22839_cov171-Amphora_coffeaeformis.AAC.4
MANVIRSVRFQGWGDEQEEIERKRSERGVEQRKELRKRKAGLIVFGFLSSAAPMNLPIVFVSELQTSWFKKGKREMAAERKRQDEEIDLLLRYLYNFRAVPPAAPSSPQLSPRTSTNFLAHLGQFVRWQR